MQMQPERADQSIFPLLNLDVKGVIPRSGQYFYAVGVSGLREPEWRPSLRSRAYTFHVLG